MPKRPDKRHWSGFSNNQMLHDQKLDKFRVAVALDFAYYDFVKTQGALQMTPAMAGRSPRVTMAVQVRLRK